MKPEIRAALQQAKAEFFVAAREHGVGSPEATAAFQRVSDVFIQQTLAVQNAKELFAAS